MCTRHLRTVPESADSFDARSKSTPSQAYWVRPYRPDLVSESVDFPRELVTFCGTHEHHLHTTLVHAQLTNQLPGKTNSPLCPQIPCLVRAVSRMTANDQHAIGALLQRLQDEVQVKARRAWHPDYPTRHVVLQLHRTR